jgi:hypothetical protein
LIILDYVKPFIVDSNFIDTMSIQQMKKAYYRKSVKRDLAVIKAHFKTLLQSVRELGWVSLYSDWLGRGSIFPYFSVSGPVLTPTQPPIQWVPRALLTGVKRRNMKLAALLHLVPRSRMVDL